MRYHVAPALGPHADFEPRVHLVRLIAHVLVTAPQQEACPYGRQRHCEDVKSSEGIPAEPAHAAHNTSTVRQADACRPPCIVKTELHRQLRPAAQSTHKLVRATTHACAGVQDAAAVSLGKETALQQYLLG